MISKSMIMKMRTDQYGLFCLVYDAAKKIRNDLACIYNMYANQEERFDATFSIDDDLKTFMNQVKRANRICRDEFGNYLLKYDDYLRTRGGQYALAKEIIKMMDEVTYGILQTEESKKAA